ncbi:IS3 family transposase [Xanthomonas arboricola pv. juglandis]|nr:IS3 family transposase [Xanthomonas arboricola pv. juglandis]
MQLARCAGDAHRRSNVLLVKQEVQEFGPSELKRLRVLEEKNRKLKQLVADLSMDKAML